MENQDLQFIPFHSLQDAGWNEAWTLYEASFPENERWKADAYARALADDPLFTADAIHVGGQFAGLIFHWDIGSFCYIEHLAIDPSLRNQKIGSRVVEAMIRRKKRLLLEIEMPEDELTRRRMNFYMRMGLQANPRYDYIHPSYHAPFENYPLLLMSYPEPLTPQEAVHMADFMREHVLRRYSEHTDPVLPRIVLPEE